MISVGKLNGQIRHICINITDANKHLGIQASKYWISYLKMLMWVSVQCCQLHLFDLSCMFTIQMCTVSHLPHHYIRVGVWIFGSKFICLLLRIQPLSEERLTMLVEYLIPAAVQQVCLSPVDSLAQQNTVAWLFPKPCYSQRRDAAPCPTVLVAFVSPASSHVAWQPQDSDLAPHPPECCSALQQVWAALCGT